MVTYHSQVDTSDLHAVAKELETIRRILIGSCTRLEISIREVEA